MWSLKAEAVPSSLAKTKSAPSIVLVDDDPVFGKLMAMIALKQKLPFVFVNPEKESLQKLTELNFDIAILDYDLGKNTGLQLAQLLKRKGKTAPIVMVSASKFVDSTLWPKAVRSLVCKKVGPYAILVSALRAYDSTEESKIEIIE
jgi:CheY-like chemotaxis protein